MTKESETPNFHDINQQRKATRYTQKEMKDLGLDINQETGDQLVELNIKANKFKPSTISEGKNILNNQEKESISHTSIDIDKVLETFNEKDVQEFINYELILSKIENLKAGKTKALKKIFENPLLKANIEPLLAGINAEQNKQKTIVENLRSSSFDVFRAIDFIEYKQDISKEGHIIETPEVENYISQIEERILSGKPIFIHGPTGTGKTSLAKRASKQITNNSPQMVYCNPNLRQSDVWGSKGIEPVKDNPGAIKTVDIYGPLTKSMIEGSGCIFDEFNLLGDGEMAFLKGILNAKVGDEVNIPGNGKIKIDQGFHLIFSANLKSDKHQDRREIPNEMLREFAQNNIEVNYQTIQESYDIFMTRLLDIDGTVEMSDYDMSVTIPQLVKAISEIQDTYAYKEDGLKKLVMTQGDVDAIVNTWKIESLHKKDQSFVEFIDKRLQIMLTFKEYPEEDRILASKILARKGFLRTLTEGDLGLKDKKVFAGITNKDGTILNTNIEQSKKVKKYTLLEIAKLDPFGVRVEKANLQARGLLEDGEEENQNQNTKEHKNKNIEVISLQALQNNADAWGYTQDQKDTIGTKMEVVNTTKDIWSKPDSELTDTDKSKFGEATVNSESAPDFENIKAVLTEKELFPNIDFTKETNRLNAIRKFIEEVEKLEKTSGKKYYIPGLDYMEYLHQNPAKIPQNIKDENYYHYAGASFRDRDGDLVVPCSDWRGSSLNRDGCYVSYSWDSNGRFLVLEI
jgi:MoxR-like ATPase